MRKARTFKTFILSLGAIMAITSVGFSAFLEVDGTASQGGLVNMDSNSKAVCYNETTGTYYTSIEKALQVGNGNQTADVIYVIPGINPTISKSCMISKEDTLVLPYEAAEYLGSSNQYFYRTVTSDDMPTTEDYDSVKTATRLANVYYNSANITSTITVTNGATITINGALFIGGVQSGSSGGYIAGFVTKCAKMVLSNGASIQNNGTFVNFGYVVGEDTKDSTEPHIINAAGSMSYGPFVVVEHRGGSAFYGLRECDGSPFNRFYFPSFVNAAVEYKNSAAFTAIPDLYAGDQHNRCKVSIIGTDGLIDPKDDFSVISLFTFEDSEGNANLNGGVMPKNYLNFYGSFGINSLLLTVSFSLFSLPLSTSSCYFPISCYYDVQLNKAENGNQSIVSSEKQKIKILPGGRLVIGESVSLSCPGLANYAAYSSDKYNSGTGEYEDINGYAGAIKYEKMDEDGTLIVNGSLSATELGGFVQTSVSGAVLTFETNSVTMYEVSPDYKTITLPKVGETKTGFFYSFTLSASGYVGDASTSYSPLYVGNYVSYGKYWCTDVFAVSLDCTEGKSEAGQSASYEITATCLPNQALSSGIVYNWSCYKGKELISSEDAKSILSSETGQTITLTTPANSDIEDVNYTLECTVDYIKANGESGQVSARSGYFVASKTEKTTDTFSIDAEADRKEIVYVSDSVFSTVKLIARAVDETGNDTTDNYDISYEISEQAKAMQTKVSSSTYTNDYISTDETIATINESNGLVTPSGIAGKVTVSATFKKGGASVGYVTFKDGIIVHTIDVIEGGSSSPGTNKASEIDVNGQKMFEFNINTSSTSATKNAYIWFRYDVCTELKPNFELSDYDKNEGTDNKVSAKIDTKKEFKAYTKNSVKNYYTFVTITSTQNERQSGKLCFEVFGCAIPIWFTRIQS